MSFAIVDAAAGVEARACGCVGRSRYSIPIANLPLIYHVFDELAAAGIDRVQMIVSPSVREELEQVLGGGRPWGVEVAYTTAPEHDGRAAALGELERVISEEPVLLYPGDSLFPGQVSAMWQRFRSGDVDAVVLGSGNGAGRRGRGAVAELSPRVTWPPRSSLVHPFSTGCEARAQTTTTSRTGSAPATAASPYASSAPTGATARRPKSF